MKKDHPSMGIEKHDVMPGTGTTTEPYFGPRGVKGSTSAL